MPIRGRRDGDCLVRWGGVEFSNVVLLAGVFGLLVRRADDGDAVLHTRILYEVCCDCIFTRFIRCGVAGFAV